MKPKHFISVLISLVVLNITVTLTSYQQAKASIVADVLTEDIRHAK
ncbi:MAG: hypothetical protein ACOYJG_06110 [Prevotella sp.]